MFAEIPVASVYLMIVGGLATALGKAALRRDWSWVLALGLPLLLAGERAGLPAAIFAWGCAVYAVTLLLLAGGLAMRTIGMPIGTALLGALLLAALSAMPAGAQLHGAATLSLRRPPGFGVELASMLGQLADDPRYAAD